MIAFVLQTAAQSRKGSFTVSGFITRHTLTPSTEPKSRSQLSPGWDSPRSDPHCGHRRTFSGHTSQPVSGNLNLAFSSISAANSTASSFLLHKIFCSAQVERDSCSLPGVTKLFWLKAKHFRLLGLLVQPLGAATETYKLPRTVCKRMGVGRCQ